MNLTRSTLVERLKNQKELFDRYRAILLKWNQVINLTAITQPEEIDELHFMDSLALAFVIESQNVSRETFCFAPTKDSLAILDFGSGGGFPGLVLKIAHPEWNLTLVDAVRKKCDFMNAAAREIGVDVQVVHTRLTPVKPLRLFDLFVSRATSKLPELVELAGAHLKPGGFLMSMKGPESDEEIQSAQGMLSKNSLSAIEIVEYQLPHSKAHRRIIIATKD